MEKTVIVLGGSSHLGRNIIESFLSDDVEIITTYFKRELYKTDNNKIKAYKVNMMDLSSINLFCSELIEILKSKSQEKVLLINCIGIYYKKSIEEFDIPTFHNMIQIHCSSFLKILSSLLSNLDVIDRFDCIYVSTNLTKRCNKDSYLYLSGKAAMEKVLKQLAFQYRNNNKIRINIISPGFFGVMGVNKEKKLILDMTDSTSRICDIVKCIRFLWETECINGIDITIDGGESIGYVW